MKCHLISRLLLHKVHKLPYYVRNKAYSVSSDAYRSSNPLFELTQVSYRPELNATGGPVRAADTINTDVVITAKRKSTETVAALAAELEGRTQVARNLDVVLTSRDQNNRWKTAGKS